MNFKSSVGTWHSNGLESNRVDLKSNLVDPALDVLDCLINATQMDPTIDFTRLKPFDLIRIWPTRPTSFLVFLFFGIFIENTKKRRYFCL